MIDRSSIRHPGILVLLFAVGSASLAAGFATLWAGWIWSPPDEDTLIVFLPVTGVLVISIALMVGWSVLAGGQSRWIALSLVAVLLTGYSIWWIWTVGMLLLPIGLGLFVISMARIVLYALFQRQQLDSR